MVLYSDYGNEEEVADCNVDIRAPEKEFENLNGKMRVISNQNWKVDENFFEHWRNWDSIRELRIRFNFSCISDVMQRKSARAIG